MALTQEQKEQFWSEGYLAYGNVLSAAEIAALTQRCEEIATGERTHLPETFIQVEPAITQGKATADSRFNSIRKMTDLAYHDDVYRAVATKPAIVDVIDDLIGPDIKLYTDQLMMKPPGVGSAAGWHQDSAAWMFFVPHNHVSCWIALDDATLENGCMRVIKGSHRFGIIERTRIPAFLTPEELANETAVPLPAGSCMFHHGLTLHGSHANNSPYRRRGLAIHYIQSTVRYLPREGDTRREFMLIRGREFPGCV